ncbi:hypothetical protein ALC57_02577 [Trachymyrmex cornetzi]|uniref:Gustatory receptor n=1 Tax=Trachymyrmex cornetzi TaxID=471704 RepID=A0A151JNH0_9HYME|nr:hypothetical protein ALC57_02577 [Trachymyrmex cornetzi]
MCLRELAIVDNTLEALGTPKEYQKLYNWIILIIVGWIVYVFCQLAFTYFVVFSYLPFDIICFVKLTYIVFLVNYPSNVIMLSALISAAILGCISCRFRRVNERLRVLYSDLFESSADYRRQNRSIFVHQRITEAKDHNQYIIWIIMHVHLQLCFISRKLNKVLKVQILIQIVWYFTKALPFYVFMYKLFGDHQIIWTFSKVFTSLCDCSDFVLKTILFLTLHYICQTIYNKINEIVTILHKLSNYNLDKDLREQVSNYNKILFYNFNFLCVILLALKIRISA